MSPITVVAILLIILFVWLDDVATVRSSRNALAQGRACEWLAFKPRHPGSGFRRLYRFRKPTTPSPKP